MDQADMEIAARLDYAHRGSLDSRQREDGQRIMAKELWEQQRAQHSLAKGPLNAQERREKFEELLALREETAGDWKFHKTVSKTQVQRMEEVQHGSAGVIQCISNPKGDSSKPGMPQHPIPSRLKTASSGHARRPKTRSELLATRLKAMRDSIGEIQRASFAGGEFPKYTGTVLEGNKRMRELVVTHDVHSFRRKGGSFKE